MLWDPKTKRVSPQFHVMFDDIFDAVQAPDPNIKQSDTMDHLFKTNRYLYDDHFGNEHAYLFTYGGADTHPDNLTPTIEHMPNILYDDVMFQTTTEHFG
jgi:hypothetical protein